MYSPRKDTECGKCRRAMVSVLVTKLRLHSMFFNTFALYTISQRKHWPLWKRVTRVCSISVNVWFLELTNGRHTCKDKCMSGLNTMRSRQNSHHFADGVFKCFLLNENVWTWIDISFHFQVCSWGSNQQYSNIGSDNGLVPTRWQAIIWTKDGLGWWRIYASLGLNELTTSSKVLMPDW